MPLVESARLGRGTRHEPMPQRPDAATASVRWVGPRMFYQTATGTHASGQPYRVGVLVKPAVLFPDQRIARPGHRAIACQILRDDLQRLRG
jgi:hypothetical protein